MLTYGDAKKLLAQYNKRGGLCSNAEGIDLFIREVFEYLLYSGSYQDLRKFTFMAVKGVFTVPYEVESIQKVKIDNRVGSVWDRWFEFRSSRDFVNEGCLPPGEALFEEPNYYPTAYDVPVGGYKIGVLATCDEDCDSYLIVQGKDLTGREIFTNHKGEQIAGEYLTLKKGELRYTQVSFGEITGIIKPKTKGYVQLYWVDPTCNKKGFLSDYSPYEEKPAYRRYRLTTSNCGDCVKVEILARIRLKEKYADTDRIPFDTLFTLRLAAQRINADYNNDIQTADAKDKFMTSIIERENAHKRVQNGQPIEFAQYISPGRIKNTISYGIPSIIQRTK